MLIHILICVSWTQGEDLSFGETVTFLQSTAWTYFQLTGSPSTFNLATLQLERSESEVAYWPIFSLRTGEKPSVDSSGAIQADLKDLNGWTSRKLTQYLRIPDSLLSSSQPAYLGVYIGQQPVQSWTYSLSLASASIPLCPSDCQSRGNCMDGECICYAGFVDVDCSVTAALLELDYTKSVRATGDGLSFAYVRWADLATGSANVQVTWGGGSVLLLSKAGRSNYNTWMPLIEENDEMTSTVEPVTFHISDRGCDYWYFAVSDLNSTNSGTPILTYWAVSKDSDAELNKLLIVLVSLSCGLVVFWACFAIYKWKRGRPAPVETNYRVQDSTGLPVTLLDLHFPQQNFSEYSRNKPEGQDKCPICLEVWTPEAEIRVLTCDHVYHVKCIDSWFEHNTICCMCKKDYSDLGSELEDTHVLYSEVEPANRIALDRRSHLPIESSLEVSAMEE